MNKLPEGYIEGLERVSSIVSFVFPFDGYSKERYLEWLEKNGIDEKDYLKEAQDVGTFIHLYMEQYMLGDNIITSHNLYRKNKELINYGFKYIDGLKKKYPDVKWLPEQVVHDKHNRYQGTIDLVRVNEKTKTVWLYDWKSWGVAKNRWGLPNEYKKPYDKLKKVALQLSLYAETYRQKGYKIGGIYGVWLHDSGTYEYKLNLYTTKQIDKILNEFYGTEYNIKINDMFEIEILEPTKQYGNIKIKFKLEDLDNGKTATENIDNAISAAKAIASKMK